VRLRYAAAADAAVRVSVNGQDVDGLESAALRATGGWKQQREAALPAGVTLRAGKNVLKLTALSGDGVNLNYVLLTGPGGRQIKVYAGDFTAHGGRVEVIPGPRHGLFSGWDDPGHWLQWTIEGAKAGRYELRIRYATMDTATRQVRLNGEPVKGLEEVMFNSTDGWRRCEELSMPAPLVLKAGRNELRLTNVSGSLNLDELRLIPIE
jgi:hypothetical protein